MAATHLIASSTSQTAARVLQALAYLAGAVLGLVYGFDFGARIGGLAMGAVTALTSAVFCTILLTGAVDQVLKLLRRR